MTLNYLFSYIFRCAFIDNHLRQFYFVEFRRQKNTMLKVVVIDSSQQCDSKIVKFKVSRTKFTYLKFIFNENSQSCRFLLKKVIFAFRSPYFDKLPPQSFFFSVKKIVIAFMKFCHEKCLFQVVQLVRLETVIDRKKRLIDKFYKVNCYLQTLFFFITFGVHNERFFKSKKFYTWNYNFLCRNFKNAITIFVFAKENWFWLQFVEIATHKNYFFFACNFAKFY